MAIELMETYNGKKVPGVNESVPGNLEQLRAYYCQNAKTTECKKLKYCSFCVFGDQAIFKKWYRRRNFK